MSDISDDEFMKMMMDAPPLESMRQDTEPDGLDFNLGVDDIIEVQGDGVCESCGGPTFRPPGFTASGAKKRVPKLCDNCKPNVSVSSKGPSAKGVGPELRRIQDELADDIKLLGMLAGQLMPVTGMYLVVNADPFTAAVLKLCKNNPRLVRVLHRAASVAPVYTVATTVAGIAYSTQVDLKGMDPHNMVGQRLGVALAYDLVNEQQQGQEQVPTFQAAPRY